MTPLQLLEQARRERFVDEDGGEHLIHLIRPGKGPNERLFRENFRGVLPPDIKELLDNASGFEMAHREVQFTEYHLNAFEFLFEDWTDLSTAYS